MLPIGKVIQDEINKSIFTQREVISLVGSDSSAFNKLFNSKISLTVKMALKFEKVFGEGKASEWLHYQVDYLLWKVRDGK